MKFDQPPKVENTKEEFIKNFQIPEEIYTKDRIDKEGNINDGFSVLEKYFYAKYCEKFQNVEKRDDFFEKSYWKNIQFQIDASKILLKKEKTNDLDKIILIKTISDLEDEIINMGEGDWGSNREVIDSFKKVLVDENTTILEDVFLKNTLHKLHQHLGFLYINDFKRIEKETLKPLDKKIGVFDGISSFFDKKLSKLNIIFNEKQKELIKNRRSFGAEIKHIDIETQSGDYVCSFLAPGIVGVHSMDGVLVGWQKMEDIDSGNNIKDFPEIKNETRVKSIEELALFKISSSLYFRKYIKEEVGLDLSEIDLSYQFYFLDFIQGKTKKEINKLKKFIEKSKDKKDKNIKLKTFLSVEQGGREMGDKILTLGEKLPEDIAMKIFEKYGEIIDNVNKILEFAQHNFTQEINTNPELIKKIEETLYIKGKNLLSETYDNLMKETDIDCPDLEKKLERINADTITTFAIFKQAVKNGEKLPIESIDGSIFSKKKANEISKEQQNEMLELYDDNWKNYPDRDFVESLKEYFKTAFTPTENQEKNYLYTFEKDNKIRAFVRFEKQNGGLYASALNVDDASKNFGLGEAMMDESLAREAKNNILHASCRKDNHSNMRYFEKGFISRGFKKTNNTEEFDLVWDEGKNKNILAKQKTQEELKNMFGKENQDDLEIRKAKELVSLNTEIPEGKALVRCFFDQQSKEWYAIYEKVEDDYGVNFGEAR